MVTVVSDHVFEAFLYIANADKYDKPSSGITFDYAFFDCSFKYFSWWLFLIHLSVVTNEMNLFQLRTWEKLHKLWIICTLLCNTKLMDTLSLFQLTLSIQWSGFKEFPSCLCCSEWLESWRVFHRYYATIYVHKVKYLVSLEIYL